MAITSAPTSGLVERVKAARRLPPPAVAKAIRGAAGVSQQQLADELGVSRVSVARWELATREPRGQLRLRYIDLLEQLAALRYGEGTPQRIEPTGGTAGSTKATDAGGPHEVYMRP